MKYIELMTGFLIAVIVISFGAMYMWGKQYHRPLDECARSNNVYECEFVAVPKGMPKITDSEVEGVE